MSSILTNVAALAALQTLRQTDEKLQDTQGRVSSGLRVGSAADNAAYWSISTTMNSDKSSMSTVVDALGLAAAKVDTTYAGLNQTLEILKKIKDKFITTSEPGVDRDKVGGEIEQLKKQLASVSKSSSFSGENWLYNGSSAAMTAKKMVGGLTRNSSGTIAIETIDYDASGSVLVDSGDARRGLLTRFQAYVVNTSTTHNWYLLNPAAQTGATQGFAVGNGNNTNTMPKEIRVDSASSDVDIKEMLDSVDRLLKTVTNLAADLGSVKSRVDSQSDFVRNIMGVIEKGVGQLVDADMNEESTRLKAYQTQQQLAIQSLSIANTNAQNIMQLFRNG